MLNSYLEVQKKKPFRSYNIWNGSHKFLEIVENGWSQQVYGTKMFKVVRELKLLRDDLKTLNTKEYGEGSVKNYITHQVMINAQPKGVEDPTNLDLLEAEKISRDE